jgi:protein involved in polysaccharide export with SLBB domain
MPFHRLIASVAVLVFTQTVPDTSSAQVPPTAGSMAAGATAATPLRLRGGDAVRLLVQDEPELTGEYPVLADGMVLLPLIGQVRVGGLDFVVVQESVRRAYGAELVGLAVVLEPLIRVRVLGEVRLPGLYLVDATYALEDVVAQAGGLTPSASTREVVLVREGRSERLDVRGAEAGLLAPMQPGDEVLVPRRGWIGEHAPILIGAATSVLAAAVTALLVR